jgi:hypothetical protein
VLGCQPRDNAENHRQMLRDKGVDVDAPDRDEWEWPEHGGSHTRAPNGRLAVDGVSYQNRIVGPADPGQQGKRPPGTSIRGVVRDVHADTRFAFEATESALRT